MACDCRACAEAQVGAPTDAAAVVDCRSRDTRQSRTAVQRGIAAPRTTAHEAIVDVAMMLSLRKWEPCPVADGAAGPDGGGTAHSCGRAAGVCVMRDHGTRYRFIYGWRGS
eukprot:7330224-Prymnesium_polylepis.1